MIFGRNICNVGYKWAYGSEKLALLGKEGEERTYVLISGRDYGMASVILPGLGYTREQ